MDEPNEFTGIVFDLEACTIPGTIGMSLPMPQLKNAMMRHFNSMNKCGITSFAEVSGSPFPYGDFVDYQVYDSLNKELPKGLPVRIFLYPALGFDGDFTVVDELRDKYCDKKLHVAGLKQFLDGVAVSHTA